MTRVCHGAMMRRDQPPEAMAARQLPPQPAARGSPLVSYTRTDITGRGRRPRSSLFPSVALFYPLTLISPRAWRKNRSGMRARCHEPTPGTYLSAPPLRGPRGDRAFHDRCTTESNAEMPSSASEAARRHSPRRSAGRGAHRGCQKRFHATNCSDCVYRRHT